MTTSKLFPFAAALLCAGVCIQQLHAFAEPVPFACNLKALTAEGRQQLRTALERMSASVVSAKELSDGYALHIDASRMSLAEAGAWIALERQCCPFFDFQVEAHPGDSGYVVSLRGRAGVKDFIRAEFTGLRGKLSNTM